MSEVENAKIGQEILKQLNQMSDKDLLVWLKDICPNITMLDDNPMCERVIRNGKINKITFAVWDSIEINSGGIVLISEYGFPKRLVEFNKHFKV